MFTFTGFERTMPSFPRYKFLGNEEQGEHHIRIENATLEDDAEYQCQVGPRGHSKPIRADARLTILSKSMFCIICEFCLAILAPQDKDQLLRMYCE